MDASPTRKFRWKVFPFRYQNFWSKFQPVNSIIANAWKFRSNGTNLFSLIHKLKRTKIGLKNWVKVNIGNPTNKLQKNALRLTAIEEHLCYNPHSPRLNSWMSRLVKQREKLLLFNQKDWGKLLRKTWLTQGDRNK